MAVSKKYTRNPDNVAKVLSTYTASDKPTAKETAKRLGTTLQNVRHILKTNLSDSQYRMEKALRYSRSKLGPKAHCYGKFGKDHPNYIGDIQTKDGYLQRKVDGKYELVHRLIAAEMLGLEKLPSSVDVHHIDENKQNNDRNNLAIVTSGGHARIHVHIRRQLSCPKSLWEQWVSGT